MTGGWLPLAVSREAACTSPPEPTWGVGRFQRAEGHEAFLFKHFEKSLDSSVFKIFFIFLGNQEKGGLPLAVSREPY